MDKDQIKLTEEKLAKCENHKIKIMFKNFAQEKTLRFHADIKCLSIKKNHVSVHREANTTTKKVFPKKIESSFQHAIKHLNLQNNSKIFHVWT